MRTRYSHLTIKGLDSHIQRAQRNLPKLTPFQQGAMRLVISEMRDELAKREVAL
jgi:hypothetical protein